MNFKSLVFLGILALTLGAWEEEDGVIVLKDDNFHAAMKEFTQGALVEFYAPWCGHCKKLAPEYAKAAKTLKDNGSVAKLFKVDATEQKKVAEEFGIKSFPTLIWFQDGKQHEYSGGRLEREIVDWVNKRVNAPSRAIEAAAEIDAEVKKGNIAIAFWGDEFDPLYNIFNQAAKPYFDLTFVNTDKGEIKNHYKIPASVKFTMFRDFESGIVNFNDQISIENLQKWIDFHSIPTLITMNDRFLKSIFGDYTDAIILIYSNGDDNERALRSIQEASKQLKGKILVATTDTNTEIGNKIAIYYGVEREEIPAIVMTHFPRKNEAVKYIMNDRITTENILKFYDSFQKGTLRRTPRSDKLPERNDGFLKIIVGKTFKDIVLDENKDVLVYFYHPQAEECKAFIKMWETFAETLYPNRNLLFSKMDVSANEFDFQPLNATVHSLFLLPKASKNEPKKYLGDSTEEAIWQWLKSNNVITAASVKK